MEKFKSFEEWFQHQTEFMFDPMSIRVARSWAIEAWEFREAEIDELEKKVKWLEDALETVHAAIILEKNLAAEKLLPVVGHGYSREQME